MAFTNLGSLLIDGKAHNSTAVQLIPPAGAYDLEVEGLVELPELLWLESQPQQHLSIGVE